MKNKIPIPVTIPTNAKIIYLITHNQKTEVQTPSLPTYTKPENYLHFNVSIVIITTLLMGCLLSSVLITSKMLEPQYMHTINSF
jgi:hypothetical protein